MKPEVSIIVPIYNVEQFLEECLESLVNQDFEAYEIICIDDSSTDASPSIVEHFQIKYPALIFAHRNEHNIGLGATRERGITLARGRFIMFVDSDDYIKRDYVRTYYQQAISNDFDIVVGGFIRDVDGKLKSHPSSKGIWAISTFTIACAKMYRRSFLIENNIHFPNIRCGEDIYFSQSLLCHRPTYFVMQYEGYYYRYNQSSITSTAKSKRNLTHYIQEIFKQLDSDIAFSSLPDDLRHVIEYSYFANTIYALSVYSAGCGIHAMKDRYLSAFSLAESLFPQYRDNPFLKLANSKGQIAKIRYSVWFLMLLHKTGLDYPFYMLLSLMP